VRFVALVILIVSTSGVLLGGVRQTPAVIRSGFAVVTPVSGNVAGLIASETLINHTGVAVDHAVVAPSPLITSASLVVALGPLGENTTAIAIANPSSGSGGINLLLTDQAGVVVTSVTVPLGPFEQFSRFLNEFFPTQPASTEQLLLTVSSELPIALLALNFQNGDFGTVPLTSLSPPTPVPVQPVTSSISSLPGFGLGFAPSVTPASRFSNTPTTSIGGAGSLVFAQVVEGGGWSTNIAIGNTSAAPQSIRIDFFAIGFDTLSVVNVTIQPRGLFIFSTDSLGATPQ
jgi:hypothetical protein